MRRGLFGDSLRDSAHNSIALRQAAGIRRQRGVVPELIESERTTARGPMRIAANGDHDAAIGGVVHRVWNEIGMRVSPACGIAAADERILSHVHERRARAVGK